MFFIAIQKDKLGLGQNYNEIWIYAIVIVKSDKGLW